MLSLPVIFKPSTPDLRLVTLRLPSVLTLPEISNAPVSYGILPETNPFLISVSPLELTSPEISIPLLPALEISTLPLVLTFPETVNLESLVLTGLRLLS